MITIESGGKDKSRSQVKRVFKPQLEKRTLSDDELSAQKELVVKIIFNRNSTYRKGNSDIVHSITEGFPAAAVSRLVEYLNIRQNEMLKLLPLHQQLSVVAGKTVSSSLSSPIGSIGIRVWLHWLRICFMVMERQPGTGSRVLLTPSKVKRRWNMLKLNMVLVR